MQTSALALGLTTAAIDFLTVEATARPGVSLAKLEAAGIPKAIATSSRRAFVEQIFETFDWGHRFQFILTSEDIVHGKPHPEVYLLAAARFGMEPSRLLVLEDSENGCRAALAAGAVVVAVPGDHSRAHDFRGVSVVAESLADPRIRDLLGLDE